MKAAVWYGGKDVRIEDFPEPRIDKHEVLVRVKSSGICGSDLHAFEGRSKRRIPPLVMGHEFSGFVAEIGSEVQGLNNEDRVVVEPKISCGKCEACQEGRSNICSGLKFIGLHAPGAFAEYVTVPAQICYKLPDAVSFDEASLSEPLAVATHALDVTSEFDSLLIIGAGVVGLLIVMVARSRALGNIIVSDVLSYKLELAKKLGASGVVNSRMESLSDGVEKLTQGKSVDAVIEAVGIQQTLQQAMAVIKRGGHVTITGLQEQNMQIDIMKLVTNEITIRGDYLYTSADFKTSLNLIAKRAIPLRTLITHRFPLTDIAKAVDTITNIDEHHIKILLKP